MAESPVITCQCIRVPVLNGHTAAVFVKFGKKPTREELIDRLVNFKGSSGAEFAQCPETVYSVSGQRIIVLR